VQLAMYTAMRAGPLSVVLVCGQRLWRLPPQLLSCTHCLIWPWDTEAVRAHVNFYLMHTAYRPHHENQESVLSSQLLLNIFARLSGQLPMRDGFPRK